MTRNLPPLLTGGLIVFFLMFLFFINNNALDKNEKLFKPIYYSSNYVTDWDVSYGEEDRQKMDVYLRGQQYVDRNNHNIRMKGKQPPTIIYSQRSWFKDFQEFHNNS